MTQWNGDNHRESENSAQVDRSGAIAEARQKDGGRELLVLARQSGSPSRHKLDGVIQYINVYYDFSYIHTTAPQWRMVRSTVTVPRPNSVGNGLSPVP
jgi:hypothetical protein